MFLNALVPISYSNAVKTIFINVTTSVYYYILVHVWYHGRWHFLFITALPLSLFHHYFLNFYFLVRNCKIETIVYLSFAWDMAKSRSLSSAGTQYNINAYTYVRMSVNIVQNVIKVAHNYRFFSLLLFLFLRCSDKRYYM